MYNFKSRIRVQEGSSSRTYFDQSLLGTEGLLKYFIVGPYTRTQRKHHSCSKNRISVGSKDDCDLGHKNHAAIHPIGERLWAASNLYKYIWKCNSSSRKSCMFESLLISLIMLQASLSFLSSSPFIPRCPQILHPVISSKLSPILALQILSSYLHSPTNDHPRLLTPPSSTGPSS